jgi:uncharacterized protein involved in exopolysaccharide biosynthesis
MQDQGLSLQEMIGIARRRAWQIALVAAVVLAVGVPAAFLWPAVYRSTATILIEEQEIPRDLVRSTVTSYADERIQVIGQQVMTRATLMQIVEKYGLYTRERRYVSTEEILERMRQDIRVQPVSADITDRRSGARTASTIAFRLSYDSPSPAQAQQVANELVTLYLNENLRTRRQRADETSSFLAEEAERVGRQVAEIEARLAQFKRANAGRLPELMQLNMQLRDRAESEVEDVARQLRLLEERQVFLDSQLALVKETAPIAPERALEPEERLKLLRNQYAGLSGVYESSHPDLVRMRREIESLEKTSGAAPAADARALEQAKNELARLTDRYAADHPDVQRQQKRVAALEAEMAKAPGQKKPDNPAWVSLAAQREAAVREAESLRVRRQELRERVAAYNARLETTPTVEQAYRDLVRDHENATTKYKELRAKQMEAQVSLALEKDRKGERFSLIDPPQYAERPQEPNRRKMLALALFGSVAGGVGTAMLAESFNGAVNGSRSLSQLLTAPLLGAVPRAESAAQRARRRRLRWAVLAGALALAALALAATHFFVMPLESAWYVLLRRLQL